MQRVTKPSIFINSAVIQLEIENIHRPVRRLFAGEGPKFAMRGQNEGSPLS